MTSRSLPLLAGAALLWAAGHAHAHGDPLPLAAWGGFGAEAARCQRTLGRAAAQCTLAVWTARRACIEPQLAGQPCDANATALAARAARQRALDRVDRHCDDTGATSLQFLGTSEALGDVTSICRQLEKALVSAVYGPGMVDEVVLPLDAPARACLQAAAGVADHAVRFALREYRAPLDVIAAQTVDMAVKAHQLARVATRLSRAVPRFAARLQAGCGADEFEALFHRSAERFVADVVSRGACLAGGMYVQDAALCPPPSCGNGMVEPTEECDDGNAIDDDACDRECLRTDLEPLG